MNINKIVVINDIENEIIINFYFNEIRTKIRMKNKSYLESATIYLYIYT